MYTWFLINLNFCDCNDNDDDQQKTVVRCIDYWLEKGPYQYWSTLQSLFWNSTCQAEKYIFQWFKTFSSGDGDDIVLLVFNHFPAIVLQFYIHSEVKKNMFSFKEYFSEFFRHEGRRCIWGIVHNTSNCFYRPSNPFTNLLSKSAKSEFFFSEDRFWSIGKTSLIKHEELDQFMKLTIKSWKLLSYHENNHQIIKIITTS